MVTISWNVCEELDHQAIEVDFDFDNGDVNSVALDGAEFSFISASELEELAQQVITLLAEDAAYDVAFEQLGPL